MSRLSDLSIMELQELAKRAALEACQGLSPAESARLLPHFVRSILKAAQGGEQAGSGAKRPAHWNLAVDLCQAGKRLSDLGLVSGAAGNLSVRISPQEFLITPSGLRKGELQPHQLVRMTLDGKVLPNGMEGDGAGYKPSSECKIHIRAYEYRSDIQAVVHTHPPYATTFAASRREFDVSTLAEAWLALRPRVPVVPFGAPSTPALADSLNDYLARHNAFLLANHGAMALGATLAEAVNRTETLEFVARVSIQACSIGGEHPLSHNEVVAVARAHGIDYT